MVQVLEETISPKALLLIPEGYLDRPLGDMIKNKVQDAINKGFRDVVISFVKVPMANSLGMSGLIEAFGLIDDLGGEIWLSGANPVVETILETAGILNFVSGIQPLDVIKAQLT